MKNFLENQQFYYVNDKIDLSGIRFEIDEMAMEYITSILDRLNIQVTPSIEFMQESVKEIRESINKWHQAYIAKIDSIDNNNEFLMMNNISSEENGFYTLSEIDYETSENISYSRMEKGYALSSVDETFIGRK